MACEDECPSMGASQPRAESDAWKLLRQGGSGSCDGLNIEFWQTSLPATRGHDARLMSRQKAYLEPYNAATRWIAPSHASPALVRELTTRTGAYLGGIIVRIDRPSCNVSGQSRFVSGETGGRHDLAVASAMSCTWHTARRSRNKDSPEPWSDV